MNNLDGQKNVAIYPNPSVSGATLSVDTDFKSFELYNINGQIMEVGDQNSFKNLNLNQGFYVIKFKVSENIESTVKLVVK